MFLIRAGGATLIGKSKGKPRWAKGGELKEFAPLHSPQQDLVVARYCESWLVSESGPGPATTSSLELVAGHGTSSRAYPLAVRLTAS
eukprot:1758774-Rhodomonas_salina.2